MLTSHLVESGQIEADRQRRFGTNQIVNLIDRSKPTMSAENQA